MKPILLDYETTQKILIEYGLEQGTISGLEIDPMTYIFNNYIESYYIKGYEYFEYEKNNSLDITSDIGESFRLKKELTTQEQNDLRLLRKRIFNKMLFTSSMELKSDILFFSTPYKAIDKYIFDNYDRKIPKSLVGFYKSYKYYEILFGNKLLDRLLKKSTIESFKNYLTMLEKYELVKDQDWIKYLFDNCNDMGDFYKEQLENNK